MKQVSRVFLPCLKWMRYRSSRNIESRIKQVTISKRCNKWFASIQTEREVIDPLTKATSIIGIDVGISRFATFSDGNYLEPLNSFRNHEKPLKRAQKSLSRKQKNSKNRAKARLKIARLHSLIANCRNDYLHKATHYQQKPRGSCS